MSLIDEHSRPYQAGEPPLPAGEAMSLASQVPAWTLQAQVLERTVTFPDFRAAMAFVNRVADLALAEDHHPDIYISYNKVRLELSTHKIGGLSRNDFILAAKIDQLLKDQRVNRNAA